MNLGEAQVALGERGFDYLSPARMTVMLNNAKNALEDEYPWPWLDATTTGAAPLTISDLKQVLYVQDTTSDRELLGVPAQQLAVGGTDLTMTGAPSHWWLDGTTTLNTWPVSNSVELAVRYVKYSPELSASTDTPLIPVRYHPVWIDYAVVEAYVDSDNHAAAQGLLQFVRSYRLPQMIEVFGARNHQNPGYQTIRWGSEDW